MSGRSRKVRVWTRFRPTANFAHDNIELLQDGKSVNVHLKRDPKKGVVNNQILDWSFKLDGIFHNSSQEKVYDSEVTNIVTNALDGYNGTVMCYGQTGAGKTFSITGATESYKNRGIIPRALSQIYKEVEERPEYAITIRVSYLEIYNETMFDLLSTLPESWNQMSGEPLAVIENENGVYVKGLSCHLAQNEEEALNLLFEGETNRAIATHSLNKHSSRSHCIFTVYVEARSRTQSNAKYTVSKLNFVDLAGSERLGKTNSEGKTQQEAMYINKSLTFLEQVIIALADRRRDHIPFRQSKLTHCLKDSIGGNCGTLLIANVWGELAQMEETVSTLRFATRMMCVASEPAVNEVYDPAVLVKKLQKDIVHLKSELAMHDTLTNRTQITYDPLSEQQKYEIRQQVRRFLEGGLDEIDIVNIRQIQGVYDAFKEIYVQMEHDVEERLKEKYMLIDKSDPNAIAAAQKAGAVLSEDGTLQMVGESDGQSFGVGHAPKSAKADNSSVVSARRSQREKDRRKTDKHSSRHSPIGGKGFSPAHSSKGDRDVKSPHTPVEKKGTEEKDTEPPGTPTSSVAAPTRSEKLPPSTPPSRTAAFEEFKSEMGREINRILSENKDILSQKKKSYADVARQINGTKEDIDKCRTTLDQLKMDRESSGITYSEEGEIIITEQEFLQIKHLKDLKQQYRNLSEELKQIKTDVQYCQNLVDQCRKRLILEFDNWYADSFLANADDPQTSSAAGLGSRPGVHIVSFDPNNVPEDEQEKFDRLQMELLMNNPESAAFHNAQIRTDRRKTYERAMRQAQPSYRRNPGLPTVNVRNQPPSMLQVSQ